MNMKSGCYGQWTDFCRGFWGESVSYSPKWIPCENQNKVTCHLLCANVIRIVQAMAWIPIRCNGKFSAQISCSILFLLKFPGGDGPCRAFRSMCSIRTSAIIVILRTVHLKIDPENDSDIRNHGVPKCGVHGPQQYTTHRETYMTCHSLNYLAKQNRIGLYSKHQPLYDPLHKADIWLVTQHHAHWKDLFGFLVVFFFIKLDFCIENVRHNSSPLI